MADITEMSNSMTVFYYKSNGDIYSIATGIQDINVYFGDHSAELSIIIDVVVVDKDTTVINSPIGYKVNIETKQLEIITTSILNKYPIASTQ
ncbi:MAG: hypothetical protein Q8936_01640 [Bacillota bacterium]|nr:hypothetical protein [Bacillota bacterium]